MKSAIAFMLNWEIFENKNIILLYQIASAVLIGVCGTILVIMFLATILPLSKAVNFIPWLIGFNTAMTGYSLVEKMRAALTEKGVASELLVIKGAAHGFGGKDAKRASDAWTAWFERHLLKK